MAKQRLLLMQSSFVYEEFPGTGGKCNKVAWKVYYMHDDIFPLPPEAADVTTTNAVIGQRGDDTRGFSRFMTTYGQFSVKIDSPEARAAIYQLAEFPPNGPVNGEPDNPYYMVQVDFINQFDQLERTFWATINTNEITHDLSCGYQVAQIPFSDAVQATTKEFEPIPNVQPLALGDVLARLLGEYFDHEIVNPGVQFPVVVNFPYTLWETNVPGSAILTPENIRNVVPRTFSADSYAKALDGILTLFGCRCVQAGFAQFYVIPWNVYGFEPTDDLGTWTYWSINGGGKGQTQNKTLNQWNYLEKPLIDVQYTRTQGRGWRTLKKSQLQVQPTETVTYQWTNPGGQISIPSLSSFASSYINERTQIRLTINVNMEGYNIQNNDAYFGYFLGIIVARENNSVPGGYEYYRMGNDGQLTSNFNSYPTFDQNQNTFRSWPNNSSVSAPRWQQSGGGVLTPSNSFSFNPLNWGPDFQEFNGFMVVQYYPRYLTVLSQTFGVAPINSTLMQPFYLQTTVAWNIEGQEDTLPIQYVPNSDELTIDHDWNHPDSLRIIGADQTPGPFPGSAQPAAVDTRSYGQQTLAGTLAGQLKHKAWKEALEGSFHHITPFPHIAVDRDENGDPVGYYFAERSEINFGEGTTSGFFVNYGDGVKP